MSDTTSSMISANYSPDSIEISHLPRAAMGEENEENTYVLRGSLPLQPTRDPPAEQLSVIDVFSDNSEGNVVFLTNPYATKHVLDVLFETVPVTNRTKRVKEKFPTDKLEDVKRRFISLLRSYYDPNIPWDNYGDRNYWLLNDVRTRAEKKMVSRSIRLLTETLLLRDAVRQIAHVLDEDVGNITLNEGVLDISDFTVIEARHSLEGTPVQDSPSAQPPTPQSPDMCLHSDITDTDITSVAPTIDMLANELVMQASQLTMHDNRIYDIEARMEVLEKDRTEKEAAIESPGAKRSRGIQSQTATSAPSSTAYEGSDDALAAEVVAYLRMRHAAGQPPEDVLGIRRGCFTEPLPPPKTLNRILYSLEKSGAVNQLLPTAMSANSKPTWEMRL